MNRTRVKICGITRPEDALAAVAAGADAIGLVFWEPSPRSVTMDQAQEICAVLPAFVTAVALTVDANVNFIQRLVDTLAIDLLQFHGNESPQFCQQFSRPYMKAIRMRPELDLSAEIARFPSASSILLDAYRKGVPGGTGESFNWDLIPPRYRADIVLAGGLNAANIAQAVTAVRPYAVDVSGGVEVSPGVKSSAAMHAFIDELQRADLAP